MKLIVATDQWKTEAFDWPGLSEDSDHSLFRFTADIRSMVNKQFACGESHLCRILLTVKKVVLSHTNPLTNHVIARSLQVQVTSR